MDCTPLAEFLKMGPNPIHSKYPNAVKNSRIDFRNHSIKNVVGCFLLSEIGQYENFNLTF